MSLLRRFGTDAGGNMAILFAAGFAVSAVVCAVAVDAGSLYYERRKVQNGVDLAALSAAMDTSRAASIAQTSLVEAGLLTGSSRDGLTVTPGHYQPNPDLAPEQRFKGGVTPYNAVRVSLERPGQLHFAQGWAEAPTLSASAVATVTPEVAFSIGSRLASLNGGIANTLLNALLGTNIELSVGDYESLLNAEVDALSFLDALALELGITAGTYNDLLGASANGGALAKALQAVLTGTERVAASKLVGGTLNGASIALGKLFDLGRLGDLQLGTAGGLNLFADVSALELLTAALGLGTGDTQASLALTAGVPGLLKLDASLAIGEPPQGGSWYAVGPTGTVVRTAQVRLKLIADILGSGTLVGAPVHLPLYVEAAHSEAIAAQATCPTPSNPRGSATILTRPGAARVILGEVDDASFGNFNTTPVVKLAELVTVKLLGLTVLQVNASSIIEIAQTTPIPLQFSSSEIAAGTVKTAATSTVVSSLLSSLLDNLQLQVPILGLGLNLTGVTSLLKLILMPLAPTLDLTINLVTRTVGLGLGEADVRVYGVRCNHAVLVG